MILRLGSSEILQINSTIGSFIGICNLIIPEYSSVASGVILLSSDNFVLQDIDGIYLIAKDEENYG